VTAAAVSCLAAAVTAQDAHYWTYGYGPIGQLTEGTLVGGASDLSAIYYNPGAEALVDRPRFLFNLSSFDVARVDAPAAAGQGLDFDQALFRAVPAMVAFHLGSHELDGNHFTGAFLSRQNTDIDLGASAPNVSALSPDASAGYARFKLRLLEYWTGASWSRRVSEHVSLGVASFFGYRAERIRRTLAVERFSASASSAAFVGNETEYDHLRLLAKLGVAWRPGRWELGGTLTAPGFKLWGRGKAVFNATAVSGDGPGLLAASTQDHVATSYQAPWSAAVGATRRFGSTTIHTSVEWFSGISTYDILALQPAPVAGSSATIPLDFRGEAPSVVNYGVGFEQRLGERFRGYGGVARNKSTYLPGRDTFSPWDLTDVTAGLSVDRGKSRIALGVGYAWGQGELQQLVAPPDESGTPGTQAARYYRLRFSVGASFNSR
jgi:hypothetical protein